MGILVQWTFPAKTPGFESHAHKVFDGDESDWQAVGEMKFADIKALNPEAKLQMIAVTPRKAKA